MKELIKLRQISKSLNLPPGITLELLTHVNITIPKGQFVVLTGNSGSGKSTLLGILLGYEKGDSGTVIIDNRNIADMAGKELVNFRCENIGICYADKSPIVLTSTVKENIINRLKVFYNEDIEQKAEDILTAFKLNSTANQKVLSGSFMDLYRLMLTVAFCGPPPIVVIDEILDYFPPAEQKELLETILAIQKTNQITMIITSIEIEIIKQADRAINIMDHTTYEVDLKKLREITDLKQD